MGVRPMSPSANFTTYNLPPSDDGHRSSYTIPRPRGAGGSGSGRAMGAFRFLLCSRPCFQQSVDIDQEGTSFDSHQHHHLDEDHHVQSGNGDEDWKARMEMQVTNIIKIQFSFGQLQIPWSECLIPIARLFSSFLCALGRMFPLRNLV